MKFLWILGLLLLLVLVAAGVVFFTPDESRARLEAKYGVKPADYVEVAGIRLHVADTGPRDAPAVIMLHGLGSSLQTFDAWAGVLSSQFRVARIDLPGFGLTGADPTGDYSDARFMVIMAALMDKLGLSRASFVGNSMGGRLAWMFAATHPERVQKLVLISPDGFASPGFEYGRAPDIPFILRLLPYTLPKWLLRMSLVPAYADPKLLTDVTTTRYWDFMRAPGVRQAIIARTAQTVLQDPVPLLRQIQAPTLLVWGEGDAMIPIANAQDYLRAIPHSRLVKLPRLGHVPQEEDSARSLIPIESFLKE
jgi:pimeloyl-ACP methyl ester carboxylesterase